MIFRRMFDQLIGLKKQVLLRQGKIQNLQERKYMPWIVKW